MNTKLILAIAALISSVAALLGVFSKNKDIPATPTPTPTPQQAQSGAGNIQVAGQGNTVQVQTSKSERSIETCTGYFPDLDDRDHPDGKPFRAQPEKYLRYEPGAKFYDCITKKQGQFVRLAVWLGTKKREEAKRALKESGRVEFFVASEYSFSPNPDYFLSQFGAAYWVYLGRDADTTFNPDVNRGNTLEGYFKVTGIYGPHQSHMTVHLKGVRIEDISR